MMATVADVLAYLYPQGGYVLIGDTFEGIDFVECKPITKAEFDKAVESYNEWKMQKQAEKEAAKTAAEAKLAALGLNADDLKALGLR